MTLMRRIERPAEQPDAHARLEGRKAQKSVIGMMSPVAGSMRTVAGTGESEAR